MAVINVLDKHTAELIAAGEVVERPSSVVKELVENAIDAGATQITVTIVRGGIQTIEIADNGSGIEAEYIATAFIRHATSKIQSKTDLDTISTLGFRGEALASIAAVSKVSLLTKTMQDEFASLYRIFGGEDIGIQPAARGEGTTITVNDLFYNTPARMKFLKKDVSEGNMVAETVGRLALSNPQVAFTFIREGKVQFRTPGDEKLESAIYAVLSRDFAKDLVAIDYTHNNYSLKGFVTPPKAVRASRGMQYFYINGRFVKNRTMMAALEQAFRGVMMQGRFPGCVLFLTMPFDLVDVNVHPAKTEVRFANEKDVFETVYSAVRGQILAPKNTENELTFTKQNEEQTKQNSSNNLLHNKAEQMVDVKFVDTIQKQITNEMPVVKITNQVETASVNNLNSKENLSKPDFKLPLSDGKSVSSGVVIPYNTAEKPLPDIAYEESEKSSFIPKIENEIINNDTFHILEVKKIAENLNEANKEDLINKIPVQQTILPNTQIVDTDNQKQNLRYVGEVFHTYIVAQRGDEICFIDKHAAHERIIYESLCNQKESADAQILLMPITVQLSANEKNAIIEHQDLLQKNGLEVDDFGANAVVLRSVPCDIIPNDAENLLLEIANKLEDNAKDTLDEKTQWVLHSIACRAAIKAGDKNHDAHLIKIAQQVLDNEIPPFCPHGRPVVLKLTKKELEKQFGRLG